MAEHSRRNFLRGAGVAAAGVTAAAVIPAGAAMATASPAEDDTPTGDASTDSLVVYVKDAKSGRVSVMSGDREVVVTSDPRVILFWTRRRSRCWWAGKCSLECPWHGPPCKPHSQ